jgi:IS5 family transposase
MRSSEDKQLPLTAQRVAHQRNRELEILSEILDANPQIAALAQEDLTGGKQSQRGRRGMSGEQALRIGLLMRIEDLDYRELAFRLIDSKRAQWFTRLPIDKEVKVSTLQENVKRIKVETWEALNRVLLMKAEAAGIETGQKTRTDCTVVETNIHEPTDSSLLWDCVRVATRLMKRATELVPTIDWSFVKDRRRSAKLRAYEIKFPQRGAETTEKRRDRAYRALLKISGETHDMATMVHTQLATAPADGPMEQAKIDGLRSELGELMSAMKRVQEQTKRRVIDGEKVPVSEKLFSIFEQHTDLVMKDKFKPLFGHKICVTGGTSSMIIDVVIEQGNPADSTLVERSIERQTAVYGRPPRQTSFDGGFASKANLLRAKALGVEDVAFHKKSGLEVKEMTKSERVFKRLRNFRAGIEGCISALKRGFGLDRCPWEGLDGFKRYVCASVVAFNATMLARRLI